MTGLHIISQLSFHLEWYFIICVALDLKRISFDFIIKRSRSDWSMLFILFLHANSIICWNSCTWHWKLPEPKIWPSPHTPVAMLYVPCKFHCSVRLYLYSDIGPCITLYNILKYLFWWMFPVGMVGWLFWGLTSISRSFSHISTWKQEITN